MDAQACLWYTQEARAGQQTQLTQAGALPAHPLAQN